MKINRLLSRFWSGNRRVNRCHLVVEPMEDRLALSPTLPLPPPAAPGAVASFYPPNPCTSLYPPTPVFPPTPI
jgi:hypothetical protein